MAPRRRGRPRSRVELEDVPRLHLPSLIADLGAAPGKVEAATFTWRGPDGHELSARVLVDLRERHGQVIVYPPMGRCYAVELVSDAQPFGGRRWWFVCPVRRVAVAALYLPPGAERFASRQAHGLGYRSQRVGRRAAAA